MKSTRLSRLAARRLFARLRRVADSRVPDFVVGSRQEPYLRRWHLIPRNRLLNVYLHEFQGSDPHGLLHDHPYASLSFILRGHYAEVMREETRIRWAGDILFRRAKTPHRIDLPMIRGRAPERCWSLFITGPRTREWGFYLSGGWLHHEQFLRIRNILKG